VAAGVEAARRTGDARALLTPEYTWRRLDVANELIAVAAPAGDGLLSLIGLCWRAADLFLLGEPAAAAALTELRLRVDTLHCRSVLFIVRAMEVMLAIRAGQFQQAEAAASACYELGMEVGDADALAYYGAHMAAIRAFQGREAELADMAASLATSPTVIERERVFSFAAALFALRAGRPQQAQVLLDSLRRDGLCAIIPSGAWLVTMLVVVELAAALQDRSIAQAAYDALVPYAELPIMASLAVVCFGSVHRPLGVAALTSGKLDVAIEHLQAAVAASQRIGHQPAVIQARAELALAYLQRPSAGDRHWGHGLLQQAVAEANALGMSGLAGRWQDARAATTAAGMSNERGLVRMAAAPHGGWRVVLGNHIATVPDLIGMHHLARLVAEPNRDMPALALVADPGTPPAAGSHALLDSAAVAALRTRIHALRQQPVLSAGEQDELKALTHELARASGLGGRIRTFADMPERARTAVRKAVKRAIEQIASANPIVGRHLAERIETGAVCRYRVEGHEGV
jgi:hypothetical protein